MQYKMLPSRSSGLVISIWIEQKVMELEYSTKYFIHASAKFLSIPLLFVKNQQNWKYSVKYNEIEVEWKNHDWVSRVANLALIHFANVLIQRAWRRF